MVPPSHAVAHRAHEEDRPLIASASRPNPQLFPGSKTAFQRSRRGAEQQSQSHDAKILRVPHLPHSRTCALSLTWQAARARIHPRILLTNQNGEVGRQVWAFRTCCLTNWPCLTNGFPKAP